MRTLSIFFLLASLVANAQKNYSSLLDNYMKAQANVKEFSGAVLVAKNDKIIYEKAFGLANKEWNVPNTLQTKFRIGSLTKQFTAAAILQLAEAGKLNLDDKLSKYFPDFPKADSVTIHMLLNHTSGIKSYTNMPKFMSIATLPYPKDSVVAFFKNEPYEFSPGTKWNYNNSGYFLLGYIIEKVSGQSYSEFVLRNLIRKAGLENTAVDRLDSLLLNRAQGYSKTSTGWRNANYVSMELPYSAGAIVSTIQDMYAWNKALYSGKIISPAMLTKMTTPYMNKYGYGLGIDSLDKHKRIGHSGGIPGFLSYDGFFPIDNIHIIVISNNSSPATTIANTLAAILFDKNVVPPHKYIPVAMSSKDLEKFVGKYQTSTSLYEVVLKDGKLYRRIEDTKDIELKPESDRKFFYADGTDRQLNFEFNQDNSVRKVQLINNGVVEDIKKIN